MNSTVKSLIENATDTENQTEDFPTELAEEFIDGAIGLYLLIFFLGLSGNLMFCYIVCTSAGLKTVTNYFLLNLSVADIFITVFCTLNQIISVFVLGYFPFGRVFCYIISVMQPTSIFSSSFTLVVIAIERYVTILHPLTPRLTTRHTKLVVLFIWILSLLSCTPDVFLIRYDNTEAGAQCYLGHASWSSWYHMFVLSSQYLLPVLVMAYSYTMMALEVWNKQELGQVHSRAMVERKKHMLQAKQKLVKMLIVVVVLYTLCYFPLNIVWLILETAGFLSASQESGHDDVVGYIHTVFLFLALAHSCINPFVYFWMNTRIRDGFLQLLGSIPGLKQCCPMVAWSSSMDRKDSHYHTSKYNMSRQSSRLTTTSMDARRSVSNGRNGCKASVTSNGGWEAGKDLVEHDPLLARSLEMRESRNKRKGAKVSICSDVTEMTEFSEEVGEVKIRMPLRSYHSRQSTVTLPDSSLLGRNIIEEE